MKIIHIVGSIDNSSAGPSISVPRLAQAQARAGAAVELATVGQPAGADGSLGLPHIRHAQSFARTPLLARLVASESLRRSLLAASDVDVFHTHGLWLMPNVYPARAAAENGTVFVISPRGMFGDAALAFSARKKRLFWTLLQKRAAQSATLFHATSTQEAEEIRAQGLTGPIVVSPNGVDIPDPSPVGARDLSPRTVLSLGRVHPKKGLDRLVRAWAMVEPEAPNWRLRIVGPSELGYAEALQGLVRHLNLQNVTVEPAKFGLDKLAAYREASLFVLPTLNENFAMTVAEALAAGTPVIATKGAPWSGLERERCGWWVNHGPEPMAAALRQALKLPAERIDEMGARGRAWMTLEFSWDGVARPILDAYEEVRGRKTGR